MKLPRNPAALCGYRVDAYPWQRIADFYRRIAESGGAWIQPMLDLVEQVVRSPHCERLFAITSMHTLIVSSGTPFYTRCEVLRIDYEPAQDEFRLDFVEQPYVARRWSKRCPPAQAFGALEHLGRMKGWLPRPPSETS